MKNAALTIMCLIATTPLVAQNLILNGNFDTDLSDWTVYTDSGSDGNWVSRDADGSGTSGSAEATNLIMNNGSTAVLAQCLHVTAGDVLSFDLMVYHQSGQNGEGYGGFRTRFFDGPDCSGSVVDWSSCSEYAPQGSLDQWLPVSDSCTVPENSVSMTVYLAVVGLTGGTSFAADFDNVVVGNTGEIFSDGFESSDTTGWTSENS